MGLSHLVIQRLKIKVQLSEIGGLEIPLLQFHGDKTVQFAVEEKQVDELLLPHHFQSVLVGDETEVSSEGQDELTDMRHDGVLDDRLVNVLWIGDVKLLGVYEVQQILVSEHSKSLHR